MIWMADRNRRNLLAFTIFGIWLMLGVLLLAVIWTADGPASQAAIDPWVKTYAWSAVPVALLLFLLRRSAKKG